MGLSNNAYQRLTPEQLDKVGNAMVFLSKEMPRLPKTKLLKLLYVLDEFSVERSGIPFFNLHYKLWHLGPVSVPVFIELSDRLFNFEKYIRVETENDNKKYVYPKSEFCDDEFSDNDIDLLHLVVSEFRNKTGTDLINYTHRPHSIWYNAAKEHNIYDELESGVQTHTDIVLNLGDIVKYDERKSSIYQQYIEEI